MNFSFKKLCLDMVKTCILETLKIPENWHRHLSPLKLIFLSKTIFFWGGGQSEKEQLTVHQQYQHSMVFVASQSNQWFLIFL